MRLIISFLLAAVFWITMGCQKKHNISSKPVVLVSISPYDTFARKIAGETLVIKTAVPANYNSHLFEPTFAQIQGFETASVFLGIKEPFEKHLLDSLTSYNPKIIYADLGKGISRTTDHAHHKCSHHHHGDEEKDRHYWTDPLIALKQAERIKEIFVKTFPQHQSLYEKNFQALKKEFTELDEELQTRLSPFKGQAILSSHPSLGYFCERYSLVELSIECEGKTPLPSDLQKIIASSKTHKMLCIFGYEQFDNKGAIAMSHHLDIPFYIININEKDYFKNMRSISLILSKGAS